MVTDNASVNVAAASLMKAKRPSIFWNGCAAHCIDLMLEDIGKLGPVEKIIAQARQITVFLYAHTRVLALMRKTLGKDLVRSGITRFATAYLNLKSLQDNKKEMLKLFRSEELHEMGYLRKDKGKMAHKAVQSESFWKGVDIAVNYFEPMANVLRRMDSDVPAMGFFHGCMLDARKEISVRFDNDESRFKCVIDIIDKRWDSKLKSPLHLAGYFLNPFYYYPNKVAIENDGSFRAAMIHCITKMVEDPNTQEELIDELNKYQKEEDSFGMDIAIRQRKKKSFDPAKWWLNYGTSAPQLKKLAMKILSLTCSSSACERNWSAFEQVHAKKRSRLLHDRMRDLVFIKFNSRMKQQRENKKRDPIEKTIVDVLEDEDNEFITGIVRDDNLDEHVGNEDQAQQKRASTSQAQEKRKKRPAVLPRKKRKKSLQSLLNSIEEEAILSSSSNSSSESEDESPSTPIDSD